MTLRLSTLGQKSAKTHGSNVLASITVTHKLQQQNIQIDWINNLCRGKEVL
jgi:hypothetical protein